MADISLPPGAFAAAKAGTPQPAPAAPKAEAKAEAPPVVKTRKGVPNQEIKHNDIPKGEAAEKIKQDAVSAMTPAERKIYKLKDGDEEFDYDASDEEQVKRDLMKIRAADKRFQSGAELKKQAETFFEMIKDPAQLRKVLADPRVGVDVKKFAEDYLWEQIQEEQLSPEQRELKRLKAIEAETQQAKEVEKTAAEKREAEQRRSVFAQQYEATIVEALEVGGLPKTHETVGRMAYFLEKAIDNNLDLSAKELVQQVRKDLHDDFQSILSAADGEQMRALIGEANLEKLRKSDLQRLKSAQSNPFAKQSPAKQQPKPQAPKKVTGTDWREGVMKGFLSRQR